MKFIVLDVAIGLIFIYFLYSLFLTIVIEMISTWLGMRARILRQGVTNLLTDIKEKESTKFDIFTSVRDFLLKEPKQFKFTKAGEFYNEPSVKYLTRGFQNTILFTKKGKPSYISAENFYSTVINMLRQKGQGICDWDRIKFAVKTNVLNFDPETNKQLNALLHDADDDMGRFIYKLESWFDEMMDRINGWYKRRIRLMLFWIGFVLVAALNVDTISIVKTLSTDSAIRENMVQSAIQATQDSTLQNITDENSGLSEEEQKDKILNEIRDANLVMGEGWGFEKEEGLFDKVVHVAKELNPFHKKLWGLIITSLALCLGAPFWFDLLKKLVALRGSGIKPEEKQKQKIDIRNIETSNLGKTIDSHDPVDIAIWQNRSIWENQPGFIEANKATDIIKGKRKNVVELSITDDFDDNNIKPIIPIKIGDVVHDVNIKISKSDLANFQVSTNITQGGMTGTIAGRMLNLKTGKECILSSAHVLAPDDSSILYSNKTYEHKFGNITSINWSNYLDAAIIDLNDLGKQQNWSAIKNPYQVTIEDADARTDVLIKVGKKDSSEVRNDLAARIAHHSYNYQFKHLGRSYNMYSLIKLIPPKEGGELSDFGDSGALVVTKDGERPIGIIVGGTGDASFVIALDKIMSSLHISPLENTV